MNAEINQSPSADAVEMDLHAPDIVREKLSDALTPSFLAEFDPDEAERAGAFSEDALSEADALDTVWDLPMGLLAPAKP